MVKCFAPPDMPAAVQAVFASYPPLAQARLHALRRVVFEEAARLDVGALEETLKWGEPAYLTASSKAGSTIRMAWKEKHPNSCSLFFNCQSDLVLRMSEAFPSEFQYTGNRAVTMPLHGDLPDFAARAIVSMALTYHRDRAAKR
ncbi:DUF1801 domain-containing protein [Planktotalea arctica]|uniref:DUF1801 domain-containing protein n=1 Tax=Planktotalea arctica TaxID=1481893 RepID=UPI000A16CFAD|nr:DUF1801 domain-containing protein [Planktotalea arctica]